LAYTALLLGMAGDWGAAANTSYLVNLLREIVPWLTIGQINQVHALLRKAGHVAAYMVLYWLWWWSYRRVWRQRPSRTMLASLIVTLAVAVMDEGRQSWHASRCGSLRDVILDMSGVLPLAAVLWRGQRSVGRPPEG
jgi:VanZ family protein